MNLYANGVNSRVEDGSTTGCTPLYLAAMHGKLGKVTRLLGMNADPLLTVIDNDMLMVPLDIASWEGNIDVVRELLCWFGRKGCGGESGGINALLNAAKSGHVEIMAVLTSAGVVDDGSALNAACGKGRGESVKFLLLHHQGKIDHGRPYVDNICDRACRTPLLKCAGPQSGFSGCKIAQMLIAYGADTTSPFTLKDELGESEPVTIIEIIDAAISDGSFVEKSWKKGIRRLLLQQKAVRATSWAWPGAAKEVAVRSAAREVVVRETFVPLRRMLPIMRRRAGRPRVLLAALDRYVSGCVCCVWYFFSYFHHFSSNFTLRAFVYRYNRKVDGAFIGDEDEGGSGSVLSK